MSLCLESYAYADWWNASAGLVGRQSSVGTEFHSAMGRQGSTGTEWHSAMSRYDSLMSQLETTSNASSQPTQDAATPDMDDSSQSPPHRKVALLLLGREIACNQAVSEFTSTSASPASRFGHHLGSPYPWKPIVAAA